MNYEQPNVFGVGTSVNKVYLKSKAASNSYSKFLEGDPCLRRATNTVVVTEVGQVKQTVTTCALIVSSKFVWKMSHSKYNWESYYNKRAEIFM
jgi:hypothetical protein